jgi:hypothetical protein
MQRKSSCNTRCIAYLAYEKPYITLNHIILCPLFGFSRPLLCKQPFILKYIAISIGKNWVKQDLSWRTSILGNSKTIWRWTIIQHVQQWDMLCHAILKKGKDMQWCKLRKKLLMPKFRVLCGFGNKRKFMGTLWE